MTTDDVQLDRKSTFHEVELDLVVTRHERVADGVVAVAMADPNGNELPNWSAGAHIDVILSPSLTRQYSLCGKSADTSEWTIGVLRDPNSRGGSLHVHEELSVGAPIRVRGPRNHFPLINSPRYQFVAGGIGITPLIPMIEAAEAVGADWHLLYGGRSMDTMAFVPELRAYGDRVTFWPGDSRGPLDLAALLDTPREDTLVYCCGPERLLAAMEEKCSTWPEGSLQLERFAAKTVSEEQAAAALDEFEVECARSGVTVTVPAEDTIYDVLEEAGVDVLVSCMQGVCGTCSVRVLEGTPDHRDSILTEAEHKSGKVMMVCVSRSCSKKLVLDI